jgi:type I restriction enzyme, R subunit
VKLGDEVALQYYRLELIHAGAIDLKQGDVRSVKSPTDVGTGKPKDEKAPLSEIIQVLNERFGTQFTEEDRRRSVPGLAAEDIRRTPCREDQET